MCLHKMRYMGLLVLLLCLSMSMKLTAQQLTGFWQNLSPSPPTPTNTPHTRENASMNYDQHTGQLILFGGVALNIGSLNDTWEWNGSTWTQLFPANSPSVRFGASMAFDFKTKRLILFGGESQFILLNETWSWNGSNWKQLHPNNSPPPRLNAAMAPYQNNRLNQLILFGGQDGGPVLNDTWNWNGTTWTQLLPTTSPPARFSATMAFDDANNQLILFGGHGETDILQDTWMWNGTDWIQLFPATSPPARSRASMAFDVALQQLILFGGKGSNGEALFDTWAWDGTTWTQVNTSNAPTANDLTSMAPFPPNVQLILFGGGDPNGILQNETWNLVINVPPPVVGGPTHFQGTTKCKQCANRTNLINILSWRASSDPNVIGYKVFQGQKLIATIQGREVEKLTIPHRKSNKRYHYSIVAFTASGDESRPLKLSLQGSCASCTLVEGPTHFRGRTKCKPCTTQANLINILSWRASPDPNVIGYKIFQGQKLIATIQGREVEKLTIPHRKSNKSYHYSIVAFTASGDESQPLKLTLRASCISLLQQLQQTQQLPLKFDLLNINI